MEVIASLQPGQKGTNRDLDRRSGHLDRSQRKSRRKRLSLWGEMLHFILSDQNIGRKDGQGRLQEKSSWPHLA